MKSLVLNGLCALGIFCGFGLDARCFERFQGYEPVLPKEYLSALTLPDRICIDDAALAGGKLGEAFESNFTVDKALRKYGRNVIKIMSEASDFLQSVYWRHSAELGTDLLKCTLRLTFKLDKTRHVLDDSFLLEGSVEYHQDIEHRQTYLPNVVYPLRYYQELN